MSKDLTSRTELDLLTMSLIWGDSKVRLRNSGTRLRRVRSRLKWGRLAQFITLIDCFANVDNTEELNFHSIPESHEPLRCCWYTVHCPTSSLGWPFHRKLSFVLGPSHCSSDQHGDHGDAVGDGQCEPEEEQPPGGGHWVQGVGCQHCAPSPYEAQEEAKVEAHEVNCWHFSLLKVGKEGETNSSTPPYTWTKLAHSQTRYRKIEGKNGLTGIYWKTGKHYQQPGRRHWGLPGAEVAGRNCSTQPPGTVW